MIIVTHEKIKMMKTRSLIEFDLIHDLNELFADIAGQMFYGENLSNLEIGGKTFCEFFYSLMKMIGETATDGWVNMFGSKLV